MSPADRRRESIYIKGIKRQEEKAEIYIEGKELTENIDHAEDCN